MIDVDGKEGARSPEKRTGGGSRPWDRTPSDTLGSNPFGNRVVETPIPNSTGVYLTTI